MKCNTKAGTCTGLPAHCYCCIKVCNCLNMLDYAVLILGTNNMKSKCDKQLSDLNQLYLSTCKVNLSSNKKRQSNLSNFFSKKAKTDVDAEVQSVVNNLIGRLVLMQILL